jgi:hypothetical protein
MLEITKPFLVAYLGGESAVVEKWRMYAYENMPYDWHYDHEQPHETLKHFGTEVLLPPANQCSYTGGEL